MKLSVRILIGVVASVFLLAAISTPALSAGIKVGFVFSMTGGAAVYGTSQKEGVSLAIDQINAAAGSSGLQIIPVFEDDASVPQQGTNVFNKLINGDKVSIIIGPTLSNTAKITDPIAQKAGVPVLAISNTISGITEIGDYIFRDSLTENVVIPHTVKVAKEKLGLKKVAILYGNDDAMTKATYEVFKKNLQASGIQILGEQIFAKGDRDFSPQLTQIKAQNPDAIIAAALAEEASGIASQARQLGYTQHGAHHRRQRPQLSRPDQKRGPSCRRGDCGCCVEHLVHSAAQREVRQRLYEEVQPCAGSVCGPGVCGCIHCLSGGESLRRRCRSKGTSRRPGQDQERRYRVGPVLFYGGARR